MNTNADNIGWTKSEQIDALVQTTIVISKKAHTPTGDKGVSLVMQRRIAFKLDRKLLDKVNVRQEATSMDEARAKVREEMNNIHNVMYWREGTTHSQAATVEYQQRV